MVAYFGILYSTVQCTYAMISTAMIKGRVADALYFNTEPNSDRSFFTLMRIRIQTRILTLMRIRIRILLQHQSYINLRPLVHRPSKAQFWASMPPFWAFMALQSSGFEPLSTLNFHSDQIRIQIQLYTLMWIRIQFPKIMRTRGSGPDPQSWFEGLGLEIEVNYFS